MKAISPFVSIILIIAITVTVGGLVASWMLGVTKTQTEITGNYSEIKLRCSEASFYFKREDLDYNLTEKKLSVIVKNNGLVDLYGFYFQIEVDGDIKTIQPTPATKIEKDYPLRPGERAKIVADIKEVYQGELRKVVVIESSCHTTFELKVV